MPSVDVPELRRAAKRIRDREKPDLAAARRLFDAARGQSEHAVASLVFMRHRGKLREEDWPDVARWAQGIESPEAADLFAQYVVAPLFERHPAREQLARWSRSAEPLMRRLAARTAMHADDIDALAPLARDEDALVVEAVADALRVKAERDEPAVYDFLRAHPEAPRAMLRRAAAALSPEHALALTTRDMAAPRKRARAASKRKQQVSATERARRERAERARAELERAERAVEEARERVRELDER